MAAPVLGIDLGTTNSVVAIADGPQAQVISDAEGNRLVPSVVSFHPAGDVLVGYPARERRLLDAANTVYSIKRLIGRPYRSIEVQRAKERFPFALKEAPNKGVLVEARGETYTLPEVSAFVLREVRRMAELSLGQPCDRAVVTVPANFTELQRSATKAAGKIAGLDVIRILNEPTAAALAYGYGKGSRERVAVYDMGGGTFDITLLELAGDVFEVLATAGDTFLGGDDIDVLVAENMSDAFLAHHRFDPRQDAQAYERLRAAAEWSKCQLSNENEVHLRVEELAYGEGGASLDLTFGLSRDDLERMVHPLVARTFDVCEEAMRIAGIRPTQLDNVILVGGSTRMPLVARMVAEYFGREPLSSIDPDLVVAQGAALQGWALRGSQVPKPTAALGRVALKRVTRTDLQAVERKLELTREAEAQKPAQPAFAPRDQGPPKRNDEGNTREPPTFVEQTAVVDSVMNALANLPVPAASPSPQPLEEEEPTAVRRAEAFATELDEIPTRVESEPKRPPPSAVIASRSVAVGDPTSRARRASSVPPRNPLPPIAPPSATAPRIPSPVPVPHKNPEPQPALAEMFDSVPALPPRRTRPPSAPPLPDDWAPAPTPVRPPLLLDVTPHSLGVETVGGYCEHVIKRNAAIPVEQARVFSTGSDHQETVRVGIVQGESRRLEENQPLGEIELTGLRRALRGQVKVKVGFVIDADGTLSVSATDLETGRAQSVRIRLVGASDEAEIAAQAQRQERMVGA